MSSTILVNSGILFDPIRPNPADIRIEDIAHALSNVCRFNGHTRQFYSVAQHSVIVSTLVPNHLALAALFHDGSEAYISDVTRPVKPYLEGYACIEQRIQDAIGAAFNIDPALFKHPEIARADLIALATERRDLMPNHPAPWPCLAGLSPLPHAIHAVGPETARAMFIGAYEMLLAERSAA
ncbi:phosphohydrolase [Chromobacterium vaccinii]|uniref:phosphohydrolase n=1 Tax=Chromobacterium vaccinii TaxID=1108595 RepID=UPI0032618859